MRLQQVGQSAEALPLLRPLLTGPDSAQAAYRTALSWFLLDRPQRSTIALPPALANVQTRPAALVLQALSLNARYRFPEAQEAARQAFAGDTVALLRIDSAYAALPLLRLKRPAVARWLSLLLPGSGLWYAGQPGLGALSLGLTGGSVALVTFSLIGGYYTVAATVGLYLFRLFYGGGVRNAVKFVRQHNLKAAQGAAYGLNRLLLELSD